MVEDDDDRRRNVQQRNLWLLCALAAVDGMDVQLLPASFRALEASLGMGPYGLAILIVCQDVAFALSGPFWGSLADNGMSKKLLLSLGAAGWGVLTLALAFVSNFEMMAILRCINGACLGLLVPIVQSIVAEESAVKDRGYNFGWIDLCNKGFGMTIATVGVTSVSNMTILGMEGWRVAFMVVGVLSLVLALVVVAFMQEKPKHWTPANVSVANELRKFMNYFEIPTFTVICFQGMVGTIPGAAMSFATMYFQYKGLIDWQAAMVMCMFHIGSGIGSLLGGIIGDKLHRYSRNHGRPATAQLSVLLGIPLAYVAFTCDPPLENTVHVLAGLVFMLGVLSSWCSTGCNKPVFLEIVPQDSWASAMSWESCFEHVSGHFLGPIAVGFIAEQIFGYSVSKAQVGDMTEVAQERNANSLGSSIAISTAVPWMLCFFLYGLLHLTYKQDKRRAMAKCHDDDSEHAIADERTKLLC